MGGKKIKPKGKETKSNFICHDEPKNGRRMGPTREEFTGQ